ncbi:low molecular weight phosphotyrosine protein phosphatase [Microlunatus sp. Gsoil 973]|nr:low molecular weight phosphotyrosine protein phosphatase [Microlunatus sp. Gsoil 973]
MTTGEPVKPDVEVVFVCWGNICRSPIAERVAEQRASAVGLSDVRFSSAATSTEELGRPMDPRAAAVLRQYGYRDGDHVAHQITAEEIDGADLVIAMEPLHIERMRRLGDVDSALDEGRMALLTEFDPDAQPGSGVPDPWYGGPEGFEDTLAAVEAAIPGVLDRIRELQQQSVS